MSAVSSILLVMAEQSVRNLSTLLPALDPAKMSSDDLSQLLVEIHTAATEIEMLKKRVGRVFEEMPPGSLPTLQDSVRESTKALD